MPSMAPCADALWALQSEPANLSSRKKGSMHNGQIWDWVDNFKNSHLLYRKVQYYCR